MARSQWELQTENDTGRWSEKKLNLYKDKVIVFDHCCNWSNLK